MHCVKHGKAESKSCIVSVFFLLLTNLKPKLNNSEHTEVLGSVDVSCLVWCQYNQILWTTTSSK